MARILLNTFSSRLCSPETFQWRGVHHSRLLGRMEIQAPIRKPQTESPPGWPWRPESQAVFWNRSLCGGCSGPAFGSLLWRGPRLADSRHFLQIKLKRAPPPDPSRGIRVTPEWKESPELVEMHFFFLRENSKCDFSQRLVKFFLRGWALPSCYRRNDVKSVRIKGFV